MPDSISVVVPVGRVDVLLAAQLDALVDQRIEAPYEVVLARNIDDAGAVAALDALVGSVGDRRVRIVPAAGRRGAAHARNAGVAASGGDVLAFCDADDIVHPTWLQTLVGALASYDAVGGRLDDFGLSERQQQIRPPATPGTLPTFLGVPYIVSASMAVTRAVFDEVGGYDEDLVRCEDIALSWTLLGRGRRLGFVTESGVSYRHRPGLYPLVKQHFHYGRGMSQVLLRYGVPDGVGFTKPTGAGLLRPNGQPGGRRSLAGLLRRGALAAGRVSGIVEERLSGRRSRR